MEFKQKRKIFWRVVMTLFIFTFPLIWILEFKENEESMVVGIYLSIVCSCVLLFLPFVIFYRILIGKILIDIEGLEIQIYIMTLFILGGMNLAILDILFRDLFRNPPKWILPIGVIIFSTYLLHKFSKRFIVKFRNDKYDKDKKYDKILNQIEEELKKEDEEFLNQLKDGLKNIDTKDWKF